MAIKRIAIVSNSFPPARIGGIGAAHYNLYKALQRRGYEVKLFTYGLLESGLGKNLPFEQGLPPFAWRMARKATYLSSWLVTGGKKLPRFSGYLADAVSGLVLWRRIAKYSPDIVVVPDHGPVSALLPKALQEKIVFISHHNIARWLDQGMGSNCSPTDVRLASRLEQIAVGKADGVICPSSYMRDVFFNTYKCSKSVEVIPNIVDYQWIAGIPTSNLRQRHKLDADSPIIYIPSAGNPIKGSAFVCEIALRLAEKLSNPAVIYLTGAIPNDLIECLSSARCPIKIIAPGARPYSKNIGDVKCCTLCLSPCLTESFGMAQLEAQFCGLPVVAFDAGGNRDIVVDGETGYLVARGDIEALVAQTVAILQTPGLAEQMGIRSREHALVEFEPDKVLDQYISFFESVRS